MVLRDRALCNGDSLHDELDSLKVTFRQNSFHWSIKSDPGLKTPQIHRITHVIRYTLSTQAVDTRIKECISNHLEKSPVLGHSIHSIHLGYCIKLQSTSIFSNKSGSMDCIIRQANETELHTRNIKREDGFCLSKSLKFLIYPTKKHRNLYDGILQPRCQDLFIFKLTTRVSFHSPSSFHSPPHHPIRPN